MDTTKINTVEWFFGYGGNHLGLKRVIRDLQLIAVCEREGYAVANMVQKMEAGLLDSAPIWTDAKTFPSCQFRGLVDLFIASYPCQGFSCAGKREGSRDPRFLWPWVFRFVCEARPGVVFFENVEGHVSLGLSSVISDLEEAGYAVEAGIFSAEECGAAHRRKRVFILGYSKSQREREPNDTKRAKPWEWAWENTSGPSNGIFWPGAPARPGEPQQAWEPPRVIETICGLGGGASRRASNVDRLRLLGNGVYPACAAKAFMTLAAKLLLSESSSADAPNPAQDR